MRTFILSIVIFMGLLISRTDVSATVDPANPHGPLSIACNSCHTTEGWSKLRSDLAFDHGQTKFPLVGRHTSVACASCHTSLVFAEAGTTCQDCHLDIHRGQFAQNACEECHTPAKWNNEEEMRTRHQKTRFPLIGVHAALDCQQCHANGQFVNVPVDCQGCHLPTYEHTTAPSHVAGGLPTDCEQCHSITSPGWAGATFNHAMTAAACVACHRPDYEGTTDPNHVTGQFSHECAACHNGFTSWHEVTFDHNATSFPLTGAHIATDCSQCHINGQFAGTPSACYDCHRANYEGAADPNHVAGNFDHNCSQCHTTTGWSPATFDHSGTNFPLTGAHVAAACTQCHIGGQFNGTTTECYGCHQANFEGTTDPNHVAGNYDHNCAQCHNTTGWDPATIDHNNTNFPLTGAHINASCTQCHVNGQFTGTTTECYGCHQSDYEGVADPNHVAGNYDHHCALCHTTNLWTPATFDHSGTDFPLTGAHINASCTQCHANGQYQGTPTDCWSCHQSDYNGADNHASNQYPHDCAICHSTSAWQPSTFDHNNTSFPLTGAHISVNCAECHVNGQFPGTPTDCWSCHQDDYNNAEDHQSGQYPHDCLQCHNTNSWGDGGFDHSGTDFPLTGAHVSLSCTQCHVNGQFQGTPTDCWSCHQDSYEGVTDPNHVAAQYPHDCLVCHTTTAWTPATFDHSGTDFPLTGAHVSVNCALCHVNGQYQGTPTDCWSCHQDSYEGVTDPNHVAGQYPHDCLVCHSTNGWTPATFDHSGTDFPLTGAHVDASCTQCHVNGQYQGTPTDCWSCHEADYNDAEDHLSGQYPHDCTQCHDTDNWDSGGFSHSGTDFPLTGAHIGLACALCHANGQYNGLPSDCWSCHQDSYEGVTDPNHVSAQYPHDCTVCHTTTAWAPATFDHSGTDFPLTGAHVDASCTQCHTNGQYQGTPTDCWSCHQADFEGVTDPNHVSGNYDHACTTCHTTNGWTPATFDHSGTNFPLTGAHVSASCTQCHVNGQFQGTPTECVFCHQTDYNNTNDPDHQAAGFPTSCQDCHNTSNWSQAEFDHDQQWFPIYSGHHDNEWDTCSDCHTDGNNFAVFTCITCHGQNNMDEEHQGVQGYSYNSDACYNCHPNGSGGLNHPRTAPYQD